jgi:Rrf2 family transcriptional regulator, nitric oxide-sensitive transcriptional repressor
MRLTRYTDYSLRVLMYVGASGDKVSTIAEIARAYGISRDHLMKVVQELGRAGYLHTARGRSGGLALARPASEIVVGDVVRQMEPDTDLVGCGSCVIAPACKLTHVLSEALESFMAVLDGYTVDDLLTRRGDMMRLLDAPPLLPAARLVEAKVGPVSKPSLRRKRQLVRTGRKGREIG